MYDLKQSLLDCGYTGPCVNLNLLKWAIRAGASSYFFNDLLQWLETQLSLVISTLPVRDNITRLFAMLRLSILMQPSYGSDAAINPQEFRLQTLKVLIRQLQLRKLPDNKPQGDDEIARKGHGNVHDLSHLTITLNMSKNQRLVRYNTEL